MPIGGLKPKDMVGIPWRVAFALQAAGWYLRADVIWAKPNPMPESVSDRPTKAHEYLFLLTKSPAYHYDADAIKEPASDTSHPRGSGVNPKAGKNEGTGDRRKDGFNGRWRVKQNASFSAALRGTVETRNKRSVWTIPTEPTPDAHFATFPRKLVEPCILAGCPLGGVVLDPFGGSGTVGRVAEDLGRRWLLFDLNPSYAQIARRKTAQTGLLGRAAAGGT
jgi:site-specific DNA-methyltransferase (cytosine-N4-specific)